MEARVGTLKVGAQFDTLLTGRRGVVRAFSTARDGMWVRFVDRQVESLIHADVRVRVVEVTH